MLKLFVYGYLNQVHSSRQLEYIANQANGQFGREAFHYIALMGNLSLC